MLPNMPRLERRNTATLPGPAESRFDVVHWDDDLPGLGLRVLRSGTRNWVFRYRIGKRQRVITLGRLSSLTPTDARSMARDIAAKARLGHDEQADILARKAEPVSPKTETFLEIVDLYLTHVVSAKRPRTQVERKRHLSRDWTFLARKPVGEIGRREIATHLLKLSGKHGPIAANRSRATLNALFVWAIQQGFLDLNPVVGTVAPAEEKPRDRVLTEEELCAIWQSTTSASDYNRIVRLLILTGQRREEIAGMRWSEIDLDAEIFTMSAERTKNKRSHIVPLSRQVLDILKTIPMRANRDLLFGEGKGSFSGWSRSKQRLDQRSGVNDWTLHDLRRSAVTGMAELGCQPHVIEAVVNHVSGHKAGVAGTYNRATYAPEKRIALQTWANHLSSVLNSGPPAQNSERSVPDRKADISNKNRGSS